MIQDLFTFLWEILGTLLELVYTFVQVCYKLEWVYLIFYPFTINFPYFIRSLVFT